MAFFIGQIIGALIGFFLFSRIFGWIIAKISGKKHYLITDIFTLVFLTFFGGWGRTQPGISLIDAVLASFVASIIPFIIVLLADYLRNKSSNK